MVNKWTAASGGNKFDDGKPAMDLLDRYALQQIAYVLGFGREKYGADNWREGISYRRLIAAAMRHLMAISDGEDIDAESGFEHAAHLGCCTMFLLWMMKNRPDLDDRWSGPLKTDPRAPSIVEAKLSDAFKSAVESPNG